MAWDSKAGRRRQNSSATSGSRSSVPALHARQQSRQINPAAARSSHVADPFLQDFLDAGFDPAKYLNAALPPLQTPGARSSSSSGPAPVPLADLTAQTQTTLAQLNTHTTRLAGTLTQLTDDILRSGSRLAYEVELLRGETLGLAESLTDGLQDDIAKFVPGGVQAVAAASKGPLPGPDGSSTEGTRRVSLGPSTPATEEPPATPGAGQPDAEAAAAAAAAPAEPAYITQLRTLTLVRARLDSVIKTFGDAMEFVFPPSELSVSSGFLSVSAPEPGADAHSTEEKGQLVLRGLRDEVAAQLARADDPIAGIGEAARRIEALKELAVVWRGTAEERGRARFVEALAKMVEDRHRDLLREMEQTAKREDGTRAGAADAGGGARAGAAEPEAPAAQESQGYRGYGLISQLQKLRGGL